MKTKDGKKVYDNYSHVEGWLYDASKLSMKETGPNSKNPGTKYIGGSIDIATNDELTNIVSINFTYELPIFSTGKKNERYEILKRIIDGDLKTVMNAGKEAAAVLKVDGRLNVNEYYSDRNGEVKLVSFQVNEASFMHVVSATELNSNPDRRSTFTVDIIINNVSIKDADEEKGLPTKAIVKGFAFDYRNALIPMTFEATHEGAIDYFDSLGASDNNPQFTKVSGIQTNEIIKRQIESASAWGTEVREVTNTNRSWKITWAQPDTYEFDTPETITAAELKEALAVRNTRKAELKTQFDQRQSKVTAPTTTGAFDF